MRSMPPNQRGQRNRKKWGRGATPAAFDVLTFFRAGVLCIERLIAASCWSHLLWPLIRGTEPRGQTRPENGSADCLAGLRCDHFDISAFQMFLERFRCSGELGKSSVVDGEDGLKAEVIGSDGGSLGAHGEVVADREHSDLGAVELLDQFHVGE